MKNFLWLLLTLVAPSAPVRAQQNLLPPDDPRLYQSYFSFHNDLNSAIQAKKAQDAVRGGQVEKSAARLLNVRDDEFARISTIVRIALADLEKWQQDVKVYVDPLLSKNLPLDAAALKKLEDRKQQIVTAALNQLSATLTPAGWSGLRAFVNNRYRLNVRTVPLALQAVPVKPPGTTTAR